MSLLTRTLLNNVKSTRIVGCNYIYNVVRLSCSQYHTLNTSTKTQIRDLDCNKLVRREVALLSNIKLKVLNITTTFENLKKYGFKYLPVIGSPNLTLIGFLWYETLAEVNIDEFFTLLNLPDTFYSRFKVIELHVWMLLHVLPQDNRRETRIRYSLIMAMWQDHQSRAKIVQELNKNYKKNIKDLFKQFKMSLLLYDIGYSENDASLASAVWCNFFDKENVDPRYIEALVHFMRCQMNHLEKMNMKKLETEKVKKNFWLSVQPFVNEAFKKSY